MKKSKLKFLFVILISALLLEACSSVPRFTSKKNEPNNNSIEVEDLSEYDDYPTLETETGVASFYSDKFHGRITYNGEVYDMNGVSAAHPKYQMGTVIRVTNVENGKTVILKINDKMPQHPERIIDLSLGTARLLDFVNQGLVNVKIEVLKWGNGRK